jgi:hypothetical protein
LLLGGGGAFVAVVIAAMMLDLFRGTQRTVLQNVCSAQKASWLAKSTEQINYLFLKSRYFTYFVKNLRQMLLHH